MILTDSFILLFTSCCIGFLVSISGFGAASLITPMLLLFNHFSLQTILGTSLCYALLVKLFNFFFYYKKSVDFSLAKLMILGNIPGAVLALFILHEFVFITLYQHIIIKMIGYTLLFMLMTTFLSAFFKKKRQGLPVLPMWLRRILCFLFSFFTGLVVTLSSVGAGPFGITILLILFRSMPFQKIVGTEIMQEIPLILVASLGYLLFGYVDFGLLGLLCAGSLPGIFIGYYAMNYIAPEKARGFIMFLLLLFGIKYIMM